MDIETLTGTAIAPAIPDLARLRIAVFRAWPYLYDGDLRQEEAHLEKFAADPSAALVVARDAGVTVGCATCHALASGEGDLTGPFIARGVDPRTLFYFGESVLLPEHRGQGIGVTFFGRREAHARAVSAARFATFCAVGRAADDPRRPPGAVALDGFWRNRGFVPVPVAATMPWREVGSESEFPHPMHFWVKSLHGEPLPAALR